MITIEHLVRSGYENWNNAAALADAGRELEERTRFALARRFLERSLELDPTGNPTAWLSLAYTWYRDSSTDYNDRGFEILSKGAEACSDDLVQLTYAANMPDERDEESLKLFAETAARTSTVHRAVVASFASWRIGIDAALTYLGDVHAVEADLMTSDDPDTISDFVFLCVRLWRQEKLDITTVDIQGLLARIYSLRPERISTHSTSTAVYRAMERWDLLQQAAELALRHLPDEESIMHSLGVAHEKQGHIDEAMMWYNRGVGAKPSFVGARLSLIRLLESVGNTDLAATIAREIPATNDQYALGMLHAAAALRRFGLETEALSIAQRAEPRLLPWMRRVAQSNEELRRLLEQAG
jgi:tetratricopeptide (TPR) repeat protein